MSRWHRMLPALIVAACFTGLAAITSTPQMQAAESGEAERSAKKIQEIAVTQTVRILENTQDTPWKTKGAGVLVSDDGLILTAAHVVPENRRNKYRLYRVAFDDAADRSNEPGEGRTFAVNVLARNTDADLALLALVVPPGRNPPEMFVRGIHDGELEPGFLKDEKVFTVGHPDKLRRTTEEIDKGEDRFEVTGATVVGWNKDTHEYVVDARLYQGNSGGGVFREDGKLVGIVRRWGSSSNTATFVPLEAAIRVFRDQSLGFHDGQVRLLNKIISELETKVENAELELAALRKQQYGYMTSYPINILLCRNLVSSEVHIKVIYQRQFPLQYKPKENFKLYVDAYPKDLDISDMENSTRRVSTDVDMLFKVKGLSGIADHPNIAYDLSEARYARIEDEGDNFSKDERQKNLKDYDKIILNARLIRSGANQQPKTETIKRIIGTDEIRNISDCT